MGAHDNLYIAKQVRNDEFYTMYPTIENEFSHYGDQFNGKTVYCPCDDFEHSNFVRYLTNNFKTLGLSHLTATHIHLNGTCSERYDYDGDNVSVTMLRGNGDFMSDECTSIKKSCDVVVTNPPFSRLKEFIEWTKNKEVLYIGNFNAVAWKGLFPLIRSNKVRLGYTHRGMEFTIPDGTSRWANSCWFTTLLHDGIYQTLKLTKTYNPIDYPKYDNYEEIEVKKTSDIPRDFAGVMGVPITFLDKYNPKQFKIVAIAAGHSWSSFKNDLENLGFNPKVKYGGGLGACVLNGNGLYARIMVRNISLNEK